MLEAVVFGGALIGANIAYMVGYWASVLKQTEECIQERRKLVDSRVKDMIETSLGERYSGGDVVLTAMNASHFRS